MSNEEDIWDIEGAEDIDPELELEELAVAEPVKEVSRANSVIINRVSSDSDELPRVSLDVYLRTRGGRADHAAGFVRWVKDKVPIKRTIPDWESAWLHFQSRPVSG